MKSIYIPLALLLIGIGLLLGPSTPTIPDVPNWVNPINWFVKGPATVVIIEETADRAKLPASQIAILTSTTLAPAVKAAGGTFLGCFDKNIVEIIDKDKPVPTRRVPPELAPYLDAAKKFGTTPALVYKRGSKYTAMVLPLNENETLERLK